MKTLGQSRLANDDKRSCMTHECVCKRENDGGGTTVVASLCIATGSGSTRDG